MKDALFQALIILAGMAVTAAIRLYRFFATMNAARFQVTALVFCLFLIGFGGLSFVGQEPFALLLIGLGVLGILLVLLPYAIIAIKLLPAILPGVKPELS